MILGVEASPRKKGNSHVILERILSAAREAGEEAEAAHLIDYRFESCVGCEKCRRDKLCTRFVDGMTLLYPQIINSQGLVLVSPVHNYNVTAKMKAFIDRLYCFYDFEDTRPRTWSSRLADQGKKAVICAIGEQPEKKDMGFTLDAMRLPLEALGYEIIAEIPILSVFDRGAVIAHEEVLTHVEDAGRALAAAILP